MGKSTTRMSVAKQAHHKEGMEAAVLTAPAGVSVATPVPSVSRGAGIAAPAEDPEKDAGSYRTVFACASCPEDTPPTPRTPDTRVGEIEG